MSFEKVSFDNLSEKIGKIIMNFRGHMRDLIEDDVPLYLDGDHTNVPAPNSLCWRKMKHFWRGKLHDECPYE